MIKSKLNSNSLIVNDIAESGATNAGLTVVEDSNNRTRPVISEMIFTAEDDATAKAMGFVLEGSIGDCINRAIVLQNAASTLTLEAGYLLLKTKGETEHGKFGDYLKAHGMEQQRASELMRNAKFYTGLTPEQRKSVFSLGKSKLQLLSSADDEVVQDFLEHHGEDLRTLSVRGLRQLIADKTKSEVNYHARIQTLQLQVAQLEKKRAPVSPFTPRTEDIRAECLVLQKESELTSNSLRKMFEEINGDPHTPEWRYQIEQVWLTASIAAAMAADTLHAMREACSVGDLPDSVQSQHMMTPQEAKHWLVEAAAIEGAYAGREAARSDQREQAKPKGPGRPKKIKTGDAK